MAKKKIFLLDGSAIFYRSYFAFIRNPLITSKGENTSAAYGFLNTLFKLIEEEKPDYLAVIFDTKEPTFRHEIYADYKATREKMPPEMAETFPRLMQVLQTLQLCVLEKAGFEADDLIATLANRFANTANHIYIISGDKDLAQLVSDHVSIYSMPKSAGQAAEIQDRNSVKEKYGVYPEQITDWLALMGDKSDNIPGIPSVGTKTACKLIEEFKSLDNLMQNLDSVAKENLRSKIKENQDQAYISKDLVILDDKVPLEVDLDDLRLTNWDQSSLAMLLKDMEFNRLIARAESIHSLLSPDQPQKRNSYTRKEINYRLINDAAAFEELLEEWSNHDQFVFDLETDTLDVLTADIAGIAISFQAKEAYYISLGHPDTNLDQKDVLKKISVFFENSKYRKTAQNIKFDAMIMKQHGIEVRNLYFDTMVAAYLINPAHSQLNLDHLAQTYLDYQMISIEEVIGSGKNQKKMTDLSCKEVYQYACEDADITYRLMEIFEKELQTLNLGKLFHQLEMPLIPVLMDMEEQGVKLDLELLRKLSKELQTDILNLEEEIFKLAGETFNINSPQQLGQILFDKLEIHKGIGTRKPKRTKTGQYSTSEQVLERYYEHPLPKVILEYRKLVKLKNTYVDVLPDLIHPKTGHVHTSFNQTITATGRLSSVNPNLQNIPIRTEVGRQMRKAFIPDSKNSVMISADYSQIELRIMAHLSSDEQMCDSFKNDLDIHAATAALVFNVPLKNVTADQRRKAKEINFGIIYGMSKYGLSNRLEITVEEAESFIRDYFITYPKIQEFMRQTIAVANQRGYVETLKGRRRYLPQIKSSNRQLREFAERTSINTPIQGSAADMIKIAMIDIHRQMKKSDLKSNMILQVHDELVFEVPEDEIGMMKALVKDKMENALKLKVPVKVEVGIGKNWLEAH